MRIDVHRHLGGCCPVDFVWEVIRDQELSHIAETEQDVRDQMTFAPSEPRDFHRFLDKFKILNEIHWTPELIDKSIAAVCRDLIADHIEYCWMDFSINKYMDCLRGMHKRDVVRLVYDCFARHAPGRVGLLLSLKYESPRSSQRQYSRLIEHVSDLLIGIDLVGDESRFDPIFHGDILRLWRDHGKYVRAHVGEYGPSDNIKVAIDSGVTNIAHGLAAEYDQDLLSRLARSNVSVDLGLTSNLLTGVRTFDNHPLRMMIDAGVRLTIGTDDPVICNTNLDLEYRLAGELGATDGEIEQMMLNATQLICTSSRIYSGLQ